MVFSAGCAPAADTDAAPPDTTTQQQDPAEKARGIDVSHDQGEVNWAEVRAAGMAFAFSPALRFTSSSSEQAARTSGPYFDKQRLLKRRTG